MRVSGSMLTTPISHDRAAPEPFRVLDWTNLDAVPASLDMSRVIAACHGGAARLAVLVNSPRMLRAADIFAEQAGLQGAQVRVFVDSTEAIAWVSKGRH